jgi:TonB family protein
MGKIVKYCSSCDEGFGERFSFCPNCSASLQAFEMNPVTGASTPVEEPAPTAPAFIADTPAESDAAVSFEHAEEVPAIETAANDDVDLEYDDSKYDNNVIEEVRPEPVYAASTAADDDGGYHLTVIEEKNASQRNGLLLGSTIFMILFVGTAVVISLFVKPLDVGAIGDGTELAYLGVEVPLDTEEEKPKIDKDDGGGGGGGGKQEKDPASRGDLPDLTRHPTRPPDVNTPRSDDPMLQTPSLEGPNLKTPKQFNKWGLPNGLDGLNSNGPGTGGGIGSGTGTGVGSGRGTGAGTGTGSGLGGGTGDSIGDGTGSGGKEPPPTVAKVTTPLNIISKPRAQYTDEARQNQIQGVVTLKVTLLANGTIGSIVPVSRLGYGLTEKAIAAAREIKFEPQKVNGVPQSVTKTIQYSFNIY